MKKDYSNKFNLMVIDPPWSYTEFGTASAEKHYGLMSQEDINQLPIRSVMHPKNGMILVWATGPKLHYAIESIQKWGLHYRGVAFVWTKTRKSDGAIINGQGVPPTFTKPSTEFVLLATVKKSGRPLKLKKFNSPQVIPAPRGAHSKKPECVMETIRETLDDWDSLKKIEVFGREAREGWTVVGNQSPDTFGEDVAVSLSRLGQK